MRFPRSSGILLHPTSLPGPFGVGDLGPEAYRFADFLAEAGQSVWQVLPLGPTGFGDSPYQPLSCFAGNPLLISPEQLVERGWLPRADIDRPPQFSQDAADFGSVIPWKLERLRQAANNFRARAASSERADFEKFCDSAAAWLDDFAFFMALKDSHGGLTSWTKWDRDIAFREPAALENWRVRLARDIETRKFAQWEFWRQWSALRRYCAGRGIRIVSDIAFYAAHDSADVWANRELFRLDAQGRAEAVAGVPPDIFSTRGQVWGNPHYQWERHTASGYGWWIDRVRSALSRFDLLRLNHFRGYVACWEVPAAEPVATRGRWVQTPGAHVLTSAEQACGRLPLIAENLGPPTAEVEALRNRFGIPGTAVLQFAFGVDPQAANFRPHNYPRHLVACTGTHDTDTVAGWWRAAAPAERDFASRYLGCPSSPVGAEPHWAMIRTLMASAADTVIFPLQDVLGLDSEARMNTPAVPGGNWRWRFRRGSLSASLAERLREWVTLYDREP